MSKLCRSCGETKSLDEFWNRRDTKDGKQPKCSDCMRAYDREYRPAWIEKKRTCPEYMRRQKDNELRRAYGISVEEYDAMLAEQRGLCMICEDKMARPHVDHCHTTGVVRSLLCSRCNQGIGLARESVDILLAMAAYVEDWNG